MFFFMQNNEGEGDRALSGKRQLTLLHFIEQELFTQLLVHKYCSGDEHLDV